MSVKVSVIVPSFNVNDYICECIDSILAQSMTEIEIICVDATSEDGTYDVLISYSNKDSRIKLISSPVRSYGYQVNMGIREAMGEYVSIVESDDYIDKDMLMYLYRQAKKFDVDVSKGDCLRFSGTSVGNRKYVEQHVFKNGQRKFYNKKIENNELLFRHTSDQNLWSGIYRRKFLLERKILLNETPGAAFQDIGFQQQVHTLAKSLVYGDKPVYYYRTDRDGSSTNQPKWLQNVVQEYEFMEKSHIWQEKEGSVHKPYVISRMAFAFMTELRRSVVRNNYTVEGVTWLNDFNWLQKKFQNLVSLGKIKYWQIPRWMWEHFMLVLRSLHSYVDMLWLKEKFHRDECSAMVDEYDGDSFVIFSCGEWGKSAFNYLISIGKNVLAFADNDKKKWGENYLGKLIMSPNDAASKYGGYKFVVANLYYSDKLKQQLFDYGIPENQIIVYHPL